MCCVVWHIAGVYTVPVQSVTILCVRIYLCIVYFVYVICVNVHIADTLRLVHSYICAWIIRPLKSGHNDPKVSVE